jgi:plastocyanin
MGHNMLFLSAFLAFSATGFLPGMHCLTFGMRITIISVPLAFRIENLKKTYWLAALLLALGIGAALPVGAADEDSFVLTIKDHKFSPEELQVPAGRKFKLVVKNLDPTAEEFESHDLKREKIIAGNSQATLALGPLKAGTYKFVGEYNEKTAKGRIVAK